MNPFGIVRALHLDGFFFNDPPKAHVEYSRETALEMIEAIREACGMKINVVVETTDAINHPRHYTNHPSGVECITVTEHMGFNVGNAVKYLWRAGLKDDTPTIQDLKKAAWYVQREIERLEKANKK